jgi:hypothetical protein
MARFVDSSSRQNPIKVLWESTWEIFSSLDKFTKLFILVAIIIVVVTPIIVNNKQIFNQHAAGGFQPIAPYYATFYYPWFATPTYGGNWGHWAGDNNQYKPPQNWFSNYLPQYSTTNFDPATRLYGVWDDKLIYWQLQKMAEAKIGVAISSWWGQNSTGDPEFKHIITDIMNRPDNPYPNLRWTLFYEQEGFSDPSVSQIVSDLNYINANYANQSGYLKIDGKPVIFVYGEGSPTDGTETTDRWTQANSQAQTKFYIVGSTYDTNFATDSSRLDSWFHYDTTDYQYSVPN